MSFHIPQFKMNYNMENEPMRRLMSIANADPIFLINSLFSLLKLKDILFNILCYYLVILTFVT